MNRQQLTILSFGGGHDSAAILLKIIYDLDFRKKYVSGIFIVVMSDTGNEHGHTYSNVERFEKLCKENNIPFFFLTNEKGFHSPAWPNLLVPQNRELGSPFKETMVQLGTKSCTDKLKIGPIYKFVDEFINETFGYNFHISDGRGCRKKAIKQFYKDHGKITIIIGFAFGEESRAEKSIKLQNKQIADYEESKSKGKKGSWQHVLDRIFPLIDIKMDRKSCIEYIESKLDYEVMPSNCKMCPYQSLPELLWLYNNDLETWKQWVSIEQRKIDRFKHEGPNFKNHGVFNSKKLLPDKLEDAKRKFGNLSTEDLHEHKKHHGCQTNVF